MFSLKVFFVLAVMLSIVATITGSQSPQETVIADKANNEEKVRIKRFLFNLLPIGFNRGPSEDDQVRLFQQQQRVLARVQPQINQSFNRNYDDFYLQALLQQRRVRGRYFDITGERVHSNRGYYDNDNYNNRFRK